MSKIRADDPLPRNANFGAVKQWPGTHGFPAQLFLINPEAFSVPWSQQDCGSAEQLETSASCSQLRQLQEVGKDCRATASTLCRPEHEMVTERSTTMATNSQGLLAPFHQGFVNPCELLEEGGLQKSQPVEGPLFTPLQQGRG